MWYKKISCFVLVMILASSTFAQVTNWTNATGNGLWTDPENWDPNVVPGAVGSGNIRINPDTNADPNNLMGPTIGVGDIAVTDPNKNDAGFAPDTWGPEWGLTLNIEGGSLTNNGFTLVSVGDVNNPSEINLGMDGSGGWLDVINLLLGDSWWFSGGPYVTYNQGSGTAIVRDWVWLGGKINMNGGIMYVFGGFNMAVAGQPATLTTLNVAGGTLMLPLIATADDPATTDVDETVTFTTVVERWIADGYCVAYGGTGDIVIEETDSWTKVTADPNNAE